MPYLTDEGSRDMMLVMAIALCMLALTVVVSAMIVAGRHEDDGR